MSSASQAAREYERTRKHERAKEKALRREQILRGWDAWVLVTRERLRADNERLTPEEVDHEESRGPANASPIKEAKSLVDAAESLEQERLQRIAEEERRLERLEEEELQKQEARARIALHLKEEAEAERRKLEEQRRKDEEYRQRNEEQRKREEEERRRVADEDRRRVSDAEKQRLMEEEQRRVEEVRVEEAKGVKAQEEKERQRQEVEDEEVLLRTLEEKGKLAAVRDDMRIQAEKAKATRGQEQQGRARQQDQERLEQDRSQQAQEEEHRRTTTVLRRQYMEDLVRQEAAERTRRIAEREALRRAQTSENGQTGNSRIWSASQAAQRRSTAPWTIPNHRQGAAVSVGSTVSKTTLSDWQTSASSLLNWSNANGSVHTSRTSQTSTTSQAPFTSPSTPLQQPRPSISAILFSPSETKPSSGWRKASKAYPPLLPEHVGLAANNDPVLTTPRLSPLSDTTTTGDLPDSCEACLARLAPQQSIVEDRRFYCTVECAESGQQIRTILRQTLVHRGADSQILRMSGQDAQIAMNIMQDEFNKSPTETRDAIRRMMLKLSVRTTKLPKSLFLQGVISKDTESYSAGAFADIFVGEYHGQKVALKRLRVFQSLHESEKQKLRVQTFYYESLIWKNLKHAHILNCIGLGHIRHALEELRDTLSPAKLSSQVHEWAHQISLGLEYLHAEQVVHGDLRGPNILIDQDYRVRLADFGLAVLAEATSQNYASNRGGNARWLAPELIHPERFGLESTRPTCASDVFSFGCVVVELFSGQAPYAGSSDVQVMIRVPLGLRPSRPASRGAFAISDALWNVVTKCFEQSPHERPHASTLSEMTQQRR
ncbi:hypothetical protein EIP91_004806 [Steccherinum ochraceum]|uniref:Protein kinase domain-containing protein n=1 Tax=Steccherinum ochraceum TaxID=92696 RepID=A0A4V2MVY2_9APHY|nr:hypothetical protein EIP91_004806 [Steccherinum ochraceum]